MRLVPRFISPDSHPALTVSASSHAALLTALDDAASPTLDERAKRSTRATSLKTSDKYSLIRYLGLPLDVFGKVRRSIERPCAAAQKRRGSA